MNSNATNNNDTPFRVGVPIPRFGASRRHSLRRKRERAMEKHVWSRILTALFTVFITTGGDQCVFFKVVASESQP